MNEQDFAVILAGGRGERFWPLSTSRRPKQFLSLVGDRTLLAQAVDRLEGLIPPERVLVITNAEFVDVAREAAPALPAENVIGEPVGRDTAAAVALGLAVVRARTPDPAFCVLTADHVIGDLDLFRATLRESLALARAEDALLTIGLEPAAPSTSFGYIEAGPPEADRDGIQFHRARRFVEKPDAETAARYVAEGNYYWNAGMFIWSAAALERALERHRPALHALARDLAPAVGTPGFADALRAAYDPLPRISIDYALMEKADNILMARGTFAWDDVGSWPALARHLPADADGNVVVGLAAGLDARDNIVVSRDRLTALIGVRDLIVVQAGRATLVCPKDRAQDLKALLAKLREAGHDDVL